MIAANHSDRFRKIVQWVVVAFVITAGITFAQKLFQFIATASRGEMPGFAALTIIPYLIVMFGFFLLVVGAFLKGHFNDLEAPKYKMLENERELDALGDEARRGGER